MLLLLFLWVLYNKANPSDGAVYVVGQRQIACRNYGFKSLWKHEYLFLVECGILSGTDLCVGLIRRPEESYRMWCVQWIWLRSHLSGSHDSEKGRSDIGKNNRLLNTWNTLIINPKLHLISLFVIVNLRTTFLPKSTGKLIMWLNQISYAYFYWSIRQCHETCDPHFHIMQPSEWPFLVTQWGPFAWKN